MKLSLYCLAAAVIMRAAFDLAIILMGCVQ